VRAKVQDPIVGLSQWKINTNLKDGFVSTNQQLCMHQ